MPTISLDGRADGEAEWLFDRDQIHQVIWGLLQNAAETAASGAADEALVSLSVGASGPAMHVDVRDNGAGVANDDLVRIFRPFHSTKSEGTGIGLGATNRAGAWRIARPVARSADHVPTRCAACR
jgi:C4-dicarboxylate-specific signal transduction histidine kinase